MIAQALSAVYGSVATLRRRWYAARPGRARCLARPVISIGNLSVGGSGKTPATAFIARLLLEHGERPAVLSRGYARRESSSGVTVVSDRERVLADVAHAGDEPMLLARALPGVPVLVCADRYLAGTEAERRFDATVHLLDDGFQHVKLARTVDLLLVDERDLTDTVLPAGRLREPMSNASVAHAVVVPGVTLERARAIGQALGIRAAFVATRSLALPVAIGDNGAVPARGAPVFALAGIARPERFVDDLVAAGFNVAGSRLFRDHHAFEQADVARVVEAARACGASAIVTTEKDGVRLGGLDLSDAVFAAVPLEMAIEPADGFAAWLTQKLTQARAGGER